MGRTYAPPVAETDLSSRLAVALRRYGNKGRAKKYFGKKGSGGWRKLFHENSVWMRFPHGICSTASDDIVVADSGNHRIQIFDANGRVKGVLGSKGKAEGRFDYVHDVCVTSRGHIVASDPGNHRIQIFDERGNFVRKFCSNGLGDGELNYPHGVATDDKGLIYVCDSFNYRVQVFSEEGEFVRKFSSGSWNTPHYLSVTSNGRVVVSDGSHRVHVSDSYGDRHLFQFGAEGTNEAQFTHPRGVATDHHGNMIVCDSHRVQIFTNDGEFVCSFGSEGSDPGQMKKPAGVCIFSDGRIAVCDWGNHRVQIF